MSCAPDLRSSAGLRRGLALAACALAVACGDAPRPAAIDLDAATVAEVRAALDSGRLRCRDLVQASLDRIAAVDRAGPRLRAILETNPDALAIADQLDARRARGEAPGPLDCAPLVVKDNFDTADRTATTAGSLTLGDFHATEDAFLVAKLRAAGAVPIAKANMDEFAFGVSGYSSRGGQTRNAYAQSRIPGGSSGGSAVAVATGMAILATGTDTAGSVRIPATFNSLVGIKPTLGLLGRSGIVPASRFLDVPGPLARSVADAAAMLGPMTGIDPDDPATGASAGRSHADYTPFLDARGLGGARIGLLREALGTPLFGQNVEVDAALDRTARAVRAAGATLVDDVAVAAALTEDDLLAVLRTLGTGSFPAEVAEYFARYAPGAPVHDLAGIVVAGRALGPEVMRNLPVFEEVLALPPPTREAIDAALAVRRRLIEAIDAALDGAGVDALLFPTFLCPAPPVGGVIDDGYACASAPPMPLPFGAAYGGEAILLASLAGLPEISLPAGYTSDGLPIGVSLLGRAFDEPTLIRLAFALEQRTRARRAPRPR